MAGFELTLGVKKEIPVYAKNEADLFFAQGFNAARDRLFQIDLWRRRGLGQLSEIFAKTQHCKKETSNCTESRMRPPVGLRPAPTAPKDSMLT
jgi:hypothetical protein